jgi:hypothetical protein
MATAAAPSTRILSDSFTLELMHTIFHFTAIDANNDTDSSVYILRIACTLHEVTHDALGSLESHARTILQNPRIVSKRAGEGVICYLTG